MKEIKSEAKLTFLEATAIIVGHGVGSGILSVPYLASRNTWWDVIWVLALVYIINLLLHLMISELSLNNGGAQFIKCIEGELFTGKAKKIITWICFIFLGLSVIVNISGFIVGASAVFESWFGLNKYLGMIIYYVLAALVVNFGMKLVGICEKISVWSMFGVILVLLVATFLSETYDLPSKFYASSNILGLFSMVSFSLSAVMSVPQVVKGLQGDTKRIRGAISLGTGLNLLLVVLITIMTLAGAGSSISQNGALVDLASHLGGWVGIIGYIFTLLALSTSFWANTLNIRDIVYEQTHWNIKLCYLIPTIPSLILALCGLSSFVGFTRLASVIQVLTGVAIIASYHMSRKRTKESPILGKFGVLPFQIIVVLSSILATVGALVTIV